MLYLGEGYYYCRLIWKELKSSIKLKQLRAHTNIRINNIKNKKNLSNEMHQVYNTTESKNKNLSQISYGYTHRDR